ncbi:MAG: zinc-dependent peptidase [Deltaproteobacteria bacterium]|nr:zinc-dependent peptidase [Deltaproteobacteria bacterium]
MFAWLRERRRQKILEEPFPRQWREILDRKVVHYIHLDDEEKTHLEQLVQVFIAEKNFEALGGLELTDQVRVLVSAQACMLLLGLSHDLYRKVDSVLIYPSTVVRPARTLGNFVSGKLVHKGSMPLLGEAHMNGPVILVWDEVKRGAFHPKRGHNVVYHEFAHKLDMLDGSADGAPPLHGREQYENWERVCAKEYETLKRRATRGQRTFLDPYGATNPAEFFAVATEYFFDRPVRMKKRRRELYDILAGFYNQDPATRVKGNRKH